MTYSGTRRVTELRGRTTIRMTEEPRHARSLARVAAETAEWLSERVLEGGGHSAPDVAARLRLQACRYRSMADQH